MGQNSTIGRTATTISVDGQKHHRVITVTYHQTQVVEAGPSIIYLRTGGWRTATTKARMNQTSNQFGLGFEVFQKDFDWFVRHPDGTVHEFGSTGRNPDAHVIQR